MKYLWTEDTGAGLHFWELVNQLFFDNALMVESKESNRYLYPKEHIVVKNSLVIRTNSRYNNLR